MGKETFSVMIDTDGYKKKPSRTEVKTGIQPRLKKSEPRTVTVEELAKALEQGRTVRPGVLKRGSAKQADWQHEQFEFVDVDGVPPDVARLGEPGALDWYANMYEGMGMLPAIMYATFTSTDEKPRLRFGWLLSERLTDAGTASAVRAALRDVTPGDTDESVDTLDSLIFGTDKAVCVNRDARPLRVADLLGNAVTTVDRRGAFTLPERIGEGERNDTLYRQGCSLRARSVPPEEIRAALEAINRDRCEPPLGAAEVSGIVKSVLSLPEGYSDEVRAAAPAGGKRPPKPPFGALATLMARKHGARAASGEVYLTARYPHRSGKVAIARELYRVDNRISSKDINEVYQQLQVMAPTAMVAPWYLVGFANGVLDVRTMEFAGTCPDGYAMPCAVPHDWPEKEPECPECDKALADIACGDAATLANLKEIVGLAAARANERVGVFVMLTGPRHNGKSTYLGLLRNAVGEMNSTEITPQKIGEPFQAAKLVGKTLAVCDDAASKGLGKDALGLIKSIATGERVPVEMKYRDPYDANMTATLVLACNELPHLADTTGGVLRRLQVVELHADFSDGSGDPGIKEFLKSDAGAASRALWLGMHALHEMIARSNESDAAALTRNPRSGEIKRALASDSDTRAAFLAERGMPAHGTPTKEFYDEYSTFVVNEFGQYKPTFDRRSFTAYVCGRSGMVSKNMRKDGRVVKCYASNAGKRG